MIQRTKSSMNTTSSYLTISDSNKMSTAMTNTNLYIGDCDEETLPLTSTTAIATQMQQATSWSRNPFFQWTASQLRETVLCFVLAILGWHLPKLLFFPTEANIQSRPIPYTTLQSGELLMDSRYSHEVANPPIVGSSFLIFTGVWIPFMVVIGVEFLRRQNPQQILNSLSTTIGLSEAATNILKFWVRRPRPNFYHLCAFSVQTRSCTAPFHKVVEAQLSFPSGHTSLSFCSMTILALWLFQINKGGGNKFKTFLSVFIPWGWATFVGVSRIVDQWHHPSDVLAGCLLGSACATLCFTIHYTIPSNGKATQE
jgi:membrane-associated phospholipid phosphatase